MILKSHITEWAKFVPWQQAYQIEQDLILSKALVDIYASEELANKLAFRGGTALNKLYFHPASRYSEDLDFVQISAEPIGGVVDILKERLSWLGVPQRKFSEGRVTLTYKVLADDNTPIKIKIEINSREHFTVLGFDNVPFHVSSSWFDLSDGGMGDGTGYGGGFGAGSGFGNGLGCGESSGVGVNITTYKLEELLGTKLRALYQRKKGRDLFDLYFAMTQYPSLDLRQIAQCFKKYIAFTGNEITSKILITNIELKMEDNAFRQDILPLLPSTHSGYKPEEALEVVRPLLSMV